MSLVVRGARVLLGDGGPAMLNADVRVEGPWIAEVGHGLAIAAADTVVEARGHVLMPAFVDAHTHALSAGDRLDDFALRQRGASYEEILNAGGGILSTVRSVRAASEADLTSSLSRRLAIMLQEGTTTVEVKSGYGLTTAHELKMLRAIAKAATTFPGTVVPTALLGHAKDPEEPNFVARVIEETLPAVHAEFPGIAIDAFCEEGAWSVAECRKLFERAAALGHPRRIHVDQFHRLGGVDLALDLGADSVDHLEASSPREFARIAASRVFGVLLPATGFHLDGRYASGRELLDAGGRIVLATNFNPGSAPTSSMPFILALAVRHSGITVSEAITAVTSAPAALLRLPDRGRIRPGMRADLILLRHTDERMLAYEFGGNPVEWVMAGGKEA